MKSGLTLVVVLIVIGVVAGVYQVAATGERMRELQDLFAGFVWYLEAHEGEFPASAEAFVAAPFVEETPAGLVIRPRDAEGDRLRTTGRPIGNLADYRVNWGVALAALTLDDEGVPRDADGRETLALRQGASKRVLEQFTRDLMWAAEDIRAASDAPPDGADAPASEEVAPAAAEGARERG